MVPIKFGINWLDKETHQEYFYVLLMMIMKMNIAFAK